MTAGSPPVPQTGTFINGQRVDFTGHLGRALAWIEQLLGSRDPQWTLLGVEIGAYDGPEISFSEAAPNYVKVLLDQDVATEVQACYQLSHEVVHLLNPLRPPRASVLEEGIATWFSGMFSRSVDPWYSGLPVRQSYRHALDLVGSVVQDLAPLKLWRGENPGQGLSDITADELRTLYAHLTPEDAAALASRFDR